MFLSSSSPRRSCCCRYCYSKQKFSFVADELDEVVVVVVVVVKVDSSFEENLLLLAVVPKFERVIIKTTTTTSKKNHLQSSLSLLTSLKRACLCCCCVCVVYSFFPRRDIKKENKKEKSLVLSLFFSSFCFLCLSLRKRHIFALKFLRVLLFLLFRLLFGKRQKVKAEFFSSEKEGTPTVHQKKQERFNNKMGFLGLGRKKKSEAELAEEERVKRANMPWYARMFGMDSCCGNRKELKKSKDNNNTNNGASSMD